METLICNGKNDIAAAGELIRKGELVAFPTETVYGLGGNALLPFASKKIYEVKGRPSDNPLIVHLEKWEDVYLVGKVDGRAKALYDAFCPGPLTMVIPKNPIVPYETTGGRDTVAVRFPSHSIARALIRAAGVPIAAPSANVSKHVSPTDASHVFADLNGKIPMILDGGSSAVGIESTIVDLTTDVPTVLRPGKISKEQIAAVLGAAQNFCGEIKEAKAPGMKYKHYSPAKPCYLVSADKIATVAACQVAEGKRVAALVSAKTGVIDGADTINLGNNADDFMRNIYCALRTAEACDIILVQDFSDDYACTAVMDRIKKATGGNNL